MSLTPTERHLACLVTLMDIKDWIAEQGEGDLAGVLFLSLIPLEGTGSDGSEQFTATFFATGDKEALLGALLKAVERADAQEALL